MFKPNDKRGRCGWIPALLIGLAGIGLLTAGPLTAVVGALVAFAVARLLTFYHQPACRAWSVGLLAAVGAGALGAALGTPLLPLLLLGGAALVAGWVTVWALADGSKTLRAEALRAGAGVTSAVLAAATIGVASPRPSLPPASDDAPAAERPIDFVPMQLDGTGRRLAMFSLRDSDTGTDDDTFSLWSLDVTNSQVHRVFRGYPFLTVDWCPSGNQLTFSAGDGPLDGSSPLALYAARYDGSNVRRRLAPQADHSFIYSLWSKKDDLLGCWLMEGNLELPFAAASGVPRTFVVPADQGNAAELKIPGARLSLMAAWQADAVGAYMITEHGVYLLPKDGKARRLVPSGEAPLDPFPFVTTEGVNPKGGLVAYVEILFKKGEYDRIDLGLVGNQGKPRRVVADIMPMAFGWSADGTKLVAASAHRGKLALAVVDVAKKQTKRLLTDVTIGSEFPLSQLLVSRDGRYVSVDGLLESDEAWTLTAFDLESGARKLYANNVAIACGWSTDGKLLVTNLKQVVGVSPEDGKGTPIYPKDAATADLGTTSARSLLGAYRLRHSEAEARLKGMAAQVGALR